ncbi:hypothetical protein ACFLU6_07390 [Acidobacteriota bacterium]
MITPRRYFAIIAIYVTLTIANSYMSSPLYAQVGSSLMVSKNDPVVYTALMMVWTDSSADTWCVYRSTSKSTVVSRNTLCGSSHSEDYYEEIAGLTEQLYFYQVLSPIEGCVRDPDDQIYCDDTKSGDNSLGTRMYNEYRSCSPRDESGPEYIYEFQAVDIENYIIDLSSAVDLDLFVLESTLDDRACIAYGDNQIVLAGQTGRRYYIVVDGNKGSQGTYQLSVTPQDGDCGIVCRPEGDLFCDTPHNGQTTGGQTRIDSYDCGPSNETGPEIIYRFIALEDGPHQVLLSNLSANLDVLVLSQLDQCTGNYCIAAHDSAVFQATGGEDYYIVVDGINGAQGSFTVEIACPNYCVVDKDLACDTRLTDSTVGKNSRFDGYNCSTRNESGPDLIYRFIPQVDDQHTVRLLNPTTDLDLFVLTDLDNCSGNYCIKFGDNTATFDALGGVPYYIIVDGYNGTQGDFSIEVECPIPCVVDGNVSCNISVNGDTTGNSSRFDAYSCMARDESGPDHIYQFTAEEDGFHQIRLSNLNADLDLFVLSALDDCSGDTCITYGDTEAFIDVAVPGTTYYIVVDGYNGAQGTYTLEVDCPNYCVPDGTLSCDTPISNNTSGGRSRIDQYNCSTQNESGSDHIYTFTAADTGPHTAVLRNTTTDLDVFVLTSLDDCSGNTCMTYGDEFAKFNAIAGTTYYIVVDGRNGTQGQYDLELICLDYCEVDADIVCSIPVDSDTTGDRSRIETYDCVTWWDESGPDHIYRFEVENTGDQQAELLNLTVDLDVFIITDLDFCSGDNCIDSSDDSAEFYGTAGEIFYVLVDGYEGAEGPYTLIMNCPPGQTCAPDRTLECTTWSDAFTTGGVSRIDIYDCSNWDERGPDFIYSFTAQVNGLHEAEVASVANLDVFVLSDLSNCTGDNCIDNGDDIASFDAIAGLTYYIVVDGSLGTEGSFSARIRCPPSGDCVVDADLPCDILTNGDTRGGSSRINEYGCVPLWLESGPDIIYSFTAQDDGEHTVKLTNNDSDIDAFVLSALDNCSGRNCIAFENVEDVVDFDATAGTTYYIIVDGYDGMSGPYTVRVECPGSLHCVEDETLTCGSSIDGSTIAGRSRFDVYNCWPVFNMTGADVIYAFTAQSNGSHTVSLSNMTEDLDVLVLSDLDNCSGLTCISSGDFDATFNAVAGQTYYIIVDGWMAAEGDYTIDIQCP